MTPISPGSESWRSSPAETRPGSLTSTASRRSPSGKDGAAAIRRFGSLAARRFGGAALWRPFGSSARRPRSLAARRGQAQTRSSMSRSTGSPATATSFLMRVPHPGHESCRSSTSSLMKSRGSPIRAGGVDGVRMGRVRGTTRPEAGPPIPSASDRYSEESRRIGAGRRSGGESLHRGERSGRFATEPPSGRNPRTVPETALIEEGAEARRRRRRCRPPGENAMTMSDLPRTAPAPPPRHRPPDRRSAPEVRP